MESESGRESQEQEEEGGLAAARREIAGRFESIDASKLAPQDLEMWRQLRQGSSWEAFEEWRSQLIEDLKGFPPSPRMQFAGMLRQLLEPQRSREKIQILSARK